VLVMARAPRAGECKRRLQGALGARGCACLQRVLLARAGRWAQAVAPGRVHLALAAADSAAEASGLVGPASVFEQHGTGPGARLAHASSHVLERAGGPLLVIGAAMPTLSRAHADAALQDLAVGCDVSIGPTTGGGCYLLALAAPQAALADVDMPTEEPVPLLARALTAARGLRLGLLRSERALSDEADARALLADPLAPGEVVSALRSYGRAP
jgi:glycosyltransferase A (GT-A) superfamily protein (DUF2064 family)